MSMSKGKAYVCDNRGDYLCFLLYDYDNGSGQLKPLHRSWLDKYVLAPWRYRSLEVMLTGYASKGKGTEYDEQTAWNRASAAANYLVNRGGIPIDYICSDDPRLQDEETAEWPAESWRALCVEVWYS
jgi:hypothetical protein